MQRYVGVFIAVTLLLAGCGRLPPPAPTEVVRVTDRPAQATTTPSSTPPALPAATATIEPTPIETAAPTVKPTNTAPPATALPATALPTVPPTQAPSPTRPVLPSPTVEPTRPAIAVPPTRTPAPSPAPAPGAAWRGEYFANPDLNGKPALVRSDADVRFDWGAGSPDPSLPVDHFSVRWTRPVSIGAGQWRFHATTDDGVRVYVDGLPVIDQWHTTGPVTYNTSLPLVAGNHYLRVDYYDDTGSAQIHVWWEPDDGSVTDPAHAGAWRGDYFNNRNLSGTPVFSRDDAAVSFDWAEGGPGGGIAGTEFSVRWTRQVFFPGGKYQFKAKADDAVRVWFDWAAIIDQWHDSAGQTTYTREMQVSDKNHTVVVEYYQGGGPASVQVSWQPTNVDWIGNLHTCLALQDSWIKVYRLAPNDRWEDLKPAGYGPNTADGQLTLFGVPVDASYSWDGQPYRVELWVKGKMVRSDGDIFAGQPEFRIMPGQDIRTSWPCGAALPTQ